MLRALSPALLLALAGLAHAQATPTEAKGHEALVHSLAFSPDGKLLASAGFDGTVKLWDWPALKEARKVEHPGRVNCVAFSPDGKLLASASTDKIIRLSNPADGKLVRELKGHAGTVSGVAFSPDGKLLASCSEDKTVRLWSPTDGKEVKNLGSHAKGAYAVAFSSDGKSLASCSSDTTIKVYDVAAQKEVKQLKGHTDAVTSIAWLPGNNTALVSLSLDRTVRLWDTAMGKETRQLGEVDAMTKKPKLTENDMFGIAFARDGKGLATADYAGWVYLWDLSSGKAAWSKKTKAPCIYCVIFSPDGKSLVTGHDNRTIQVTPLGK